MVTIGSSSDQNFKKYLTTREPVDGYNIASIEWSDRVGDTKVTISKDGKFATLTFNQALLSQRASANAPPAPGQARQSVPLARSSAPIQAPRARVPGMNQPKPAAAAAVPTPNLMPVPPPGLELPQIKSQQPDDEQAKRQRRRKAEPERQ
jgi:hypothetical protein